MKKRLIIGACFLFILIVLMSFASAGFFSDFWGKITGKIAQGSECARCISQGQIWCEDEPNSYCGDGYNYGVACPHTIDDASKCYSASSDPCPTSCPTGYECDYYTPIDTTCNTLNCGVCGSGETCDPNTHTCESDISQTCPDSDVDADHSDGKNYYEKGWYSGYGDFCSLNPGEENTLLEYYCSYDASGNPVKSYVFYDCSNENMICDRDLTSATYGACIAGCTKNADCTTKFECTVGTCTNGVCSYSEAQDGEACTLDTGVCCNGMCCILGNHCSRGLCFAGCVNDSECTIPGLLKCDTSTYKCVECLNANDCVLGEDCILGVCIAPTAVDITNRVSFWSGKVNQHTENGVWMTDPDGSSGAGLGDTEAERITYCKKFYGSDVTSSPAYSTESIDFCTRGNNYCTYTSTRQTYECVKGTTVTPTCSDNIRNQGETGVDCGGPCPACKVWEQYTTCETCATNGFQWCKTGEGFCINTGFSGCSSGIIQFKQNCPLQHCGDATGACDFGETCSTCPGDCPCASGKYCNPTTELCVSGCGSNDDCSAPTPKCSSSHSCVKCLTAADCATGEVCTAGSCAIGICDYDLTNADDCAFSIAADRARAVKFMKNIRAECGVVFTFEILDVLPTGYVIPTGQKIIIILNITVSDPTSISDADLDFTINESELTLSITNVTISVEDNTETDNWKSLAGDIIADATSQRMFNYKVNTPHFSLFLITEPELCGNGVFDSAYEKCDESVTETTHCTDCMCDSGYVGDNGTCVEDSGGTDCSIAGEEKCTGYTLYECGSDLIWDNKGIVIGNCSVVCYPVGNMSCQGEIPIRCGTDYQWSLQSRINGLCGYISPSGDRCGNGYCNYDEDENSCPEDCVEDDEETNWFLIILIVGVAILILVIVFVLFKIFNKERRGGTSLPNRRLPPGHRPGPKRAPGRPPEVQHGQIGRPPERRVSPEGYAVRRYPPR